MLEETTIVAIIWGIDAIIWLVILFSEASKIDIGKEHSLFLAPAISVNLCLFYLFGFELVGLEATLVDRKIAFSALGCTLGSIMLRYGTYSDKKFIANSGAITLTASILLFFKYYKELK